ncbi:MAG TPA: ferredoxin reductase [Galbitalea sp.]
MTVAWQVGRVIAAQRETATARTLDIDVPGWSGNLAGQHLDLRLTAPDGYTATRSYSIASAGSGTRVQLAVDEVPGGEVSPYLVDQVAVGDELEVRGPLGGWFVWRPTVPTPVQLIAGGSGIVPLMAMLRSRRDTGSSVPFRLLYSVRTAEDVIFRRELEELASSGLPIDWVYTRSAPEGWAAPAGRVNKDSLAGAVIPLGDAPAVFVCGPTSFVEAVADILVSLGYPAEQVKTERFGGA